MWSRLRSNGSSSVASVWALLIGHNGLPAAKRVSAGLASSTSLPINLTLDSNSRLEFIFGLLPLLFHRFNRRFKLSELALYFYSFIKIFFLPI